MEDYREDARETTTFLVEHYWPGVTEGDFAAAAKSVRAATEALTSEGRPIHYLHSTLVLEDEAAFCVFEADSRSLVEEAYARAGVRYERIVRAVQPVAAVAELTGREGRKG